MFKLLLVLVVIMAVSVHSDPRRGPPTPEEAKAALIAAGVSDAGAAGISAIGAKYRDQFAANRGNRVTGRETFQQMKAEIEAYVLTLSPADQAAHTAFIQKMKAEHRGRHRKMP